ncbi:GntR family transcriptional regulator [Marinobacterium aestuariivivens]|uniref:GntR family transcriptional regulator n=1 Tax=Marinobacterium aestuariivivens TaxID=1698799 RepID=A0ABW2A9D5_9GAMM
MPKATSGVMMERVASQIHQAIVEHRFAPGMKLGEADLAKLYGVSRTTVRSALQLLAGTGVVTLYPNRGAWVSLPNRQEIEALFNARRLVEMGVVAELCKRASPQLLAPLRAHTAREKQAADEENYAQLIKLLGEFHLKLAQSVDNQALMAWFNNLTERTSLFVATLGGDRPKTCRGNEHDALLDLIEARDLDAALDNISSHLLEIQEATCAQADRMQGDYHPLKSLMALES